MRVCGRPRAARAAARRFATCRCPARRTRGRPVPRPRSPAPSAQQQRELLLAPDEAAIRPAGWAASNRLAAVPRPSTRQTLDRLGNPLSGWRPEVLVLERPPHQPPGGSAMTTVSGSASACSRAARLGVLADHRLLPRGAFADQVADHDHAGGDADPHVRARMPPAGSSRQRPRPCRARHRTARSASSSWARG